MRNIAVALCGVLSLVACDRGKPAPTRVARTPAPASAHVPAELLITFRAETRAEERQSWLAANGYTNLGRVGGRSAKLANTYRVGLPPDVVVKEAAARARQAAVVQAAQPNYLYALQQYIPNDPDFTDQWAVHNTAAALPEDGPLPATADSDIDWPEAWAIVNANLPFPSQAIVAVVDSGIDYTHPDLTGSLWTNPGEIAANATDDDANGYVDDVRGYDFIEDDADPMDDEGHGTHVAGIIGAVVNNNVGVAGVGGGVKMMALRFYGDTGGSTAAGIEAIYYAVDNGAHIINASWSSTFQDDLLRDAIEWARDAGVVVVAGAGNAASNSDYYPQYPAAYDFTNVLSVTATDSRDRLFSRGNYGPTSVDLAAPGVAVWSTAPGGLYSLKTGTSIAAAHVTGAVALLYALNLASTPQAVRDILLASADPRPALGCKVASGGRLNLGKALAAELAAEAVAPAAIGDLVATVRGYTRVVLAFTAPGDDGTVGLAHRYALRYAPTASWVNFASATEACGGWAPAAPGSADVITVDGLRPGLQYKMQLRVYDESGNFSDSNVVTVRTLGDAGESIFSHDVEAATTGWSTPAGASGGQWAVTNEERHSGSRAWTDSPRTQYAENEEAVLMAPAVDLSGVVAPELRFWSKYNTERNWDFCRVEARASGDTEWTLLLERDGMADWHEEVIDLSAFADLTVEIRFVLDSDSSVAGDGCYVDDVRLGAGADYDTTVFADTFDDNNPAARWTLWGGWDGENGQLSDSPGAPYALSSISGARLGTPLSLSAALAARASFDLTADAYDAILHLEASDDGTYWESLGLWYGFELGLPVSVDLSRYVGRGNVSLRYVLWSDDVEADGVLIDNFAVERVTVQGCADDGDPCTVAEWSPVRGCVHAPLCDDGNACNGVETCNAGVCGAGTPIVCSDGVACTADTCVAEWGCVYEPDDTQCPDADVCHVGACGPAGCLSVPVPGCCLTNGDCPAGNACQLPTCLTATNTCTQAPIAGCCLADGDCDDSDTCTLDRCEANRCAHHEACCFDEWVDYPISSTHPYGNAAAQAWVITHPSLADSMSVSFSDFDTELNYDGVILSDIDDEQVQIYTGTLGAFVAPAITGNRVVVRLQSDASIVGYGFDIDGYWLCGAACAEWTADCDGDLVTGCEVSVAADEDNCGVCGNICVPGENVAVPECVWGVCSVGECVAGFGDCDADGASGCEVDLLTSAEHCGACGAACAADVPCVAGVCDDSSGRAPDASESGCAASAPRPVGSLLGVFLAAWLIRRRRV